MNGNENCILCGNAGHIAHDLTWSESGNGWVCLDGCPMPKNLREEIRVWLMANHKAPQEVRYGSFPLGMVQHWIERARESDDRIRDVLSQIDKLADEAIKRIRREP